MSFFLASVLLATLCAGALSLIRRPHVAGGVNVSLLVLAAAAYLLPAIFYVLFSFNNEEAATRLRVSLLGVGFRAENGEERRISVGGDARTHEVWVANLGTVDGYPNGVGTLIFTPSRDEKRPGTVVIPEQATASGVLGLDRLGPGYDMANTRQLADGDEIWFFDAEGQQPLGSPQVVRLSPGSCWLGLWCGPTRAFVGERELPLAKATIPLVRVTLGERVFGSNRRTYPLEAYAPEAADLPEGPPAGYFFRQGEALYLLNLRTTAYNVRREGRWLFGKDGEALKVASGARLHVLGLPRDDLATDGVARGLRDLRSGRLVVGPRSVGLWFDTPEQHTLSWDQFDELMIKEQDGQARVSLAMGNWQISDRYLYLRNVSQRVGNEAFSFIEVPAHWMAGFGGSAGDVLQLATPSGRKKIRLGEPFWVGDRHLAALQIDVLRPSTGLAWGLLILALWKILAALSGRLSAVQLVALGAVELLLTLRLILGYRVWMMPPYSEEGLVLALVTYSLVSWGLLVASLRIDPEVGIGAHLGRWWLGLLGLGFSAWWCEVVGGPVWALVHIAVCGVLVLRGLTLWWSIWAKGEWLSSVRRRQLLVGTLVFFGLAAGVFVLRLLGALGGFRESFALLGARVALSAMHIPLVLLIEACFLVWLWLRVSEAKPVAPGRLSRWDLLSAGAILGLAWAGSAVVVSDIGLALLNMPAFLLVVLTLIIAVMLWEWRERNSDLNWLVSVRGLGAAALVVVVLLLLLVRPDWPASLLLPVDEGLDRNDLRLLQIANPERVESLGTRDSEKLLVMMSVMNAYNSGPVWGRGFGESELSPHLAPTALREHATPVFIVGEWGALGVSGMLLLYSMLGATALWLLPWRRSFRNDDDEANRPVVAAMGLWGGLSMLAFAVSSLYMILANYGYLLFTGKNVYLFGLDSGSDTIEALGLLLIFALGAGAVADEESDR